ncbi:PREDICTED: uncharacterized protein LOC106812998 isoform X2 [Priapulus caudatus]|uniref:Uncharacterized protein LOC106812998 isoform X2 n=1 Tax=Priapulus caudatus TaxID=37621 RepID=A0ABM1EK06_PRICU|nr:PREDICTED: uncharacterized protein LOC106812998 isoform X2 [Priapulus caudatus]
MLASAVRAATVLVCVVLLMVTRAAAEAEDAIYYDADMEPLRQLSNMRKRPFCNGFGGCRGAFGSKRGTDDVTDSADPDLANDVSGRLREAVIWRILGQKLRELQAMDHNEEREMEESAPAQEERIFCRGFFDCMSRRRARRSTRQRFAVAEAK